MDTTSDQFFVTQALRAWAMLVLELQKEWVVKGPFRGPRPNKAYIEVMQVSTVDNTEPWSEETYDSDAELISQTSAQFVTDRWQMLFLGEDATAWPERLKRSRPRADVIALFAERGITVFSTDALSFGPVIRDGIVWEYTRILEVGVQYQSVDATSTPVGPPLEQVVIANSPAPLYTVTIAVGD
jgi:hypothetical protein